MQKLRKGTTLGEPLELHLAAPASTTGCRLAKHSTVLALSTGAGFTDTAEHTSATKKLARGSFFWVMDRC